MAFPLLPIVIIGGLVLAATAKKKAPAGKSPEPVLVQMAWAEIVASTEIGIDVGDTLQLVLNEPTPAEWTLYTEAIGGDPIVVVTEEHVPPADDAQGDYGQRLFNIKAKHAGQIKLDLVAATGPEAGDEVYSSHSLTLSIT